MSMFLENSKFNLRLKSNNIKLVCMSAMSDELHQGTDNPQGSVQLPDNSSNARVGGPVTGPTNPDDLNVPNRGANNNNGSRANGMAGSIDSIIDLVEDKSGYTLTSNLSKSNTQSFSQITTLGVDDESNLSDPLMVLKSKWQIQGEANVTYQKVTNSKNFDFSESFTPFVTKPFMTKSNFKDSLSEWLTHYNVIKSKTTYKNNNFSLAQTTRTSTLTQLKDNNTLTTGSITSTIAAGFKIDKEKVLELLNSSKVNLTSIFYRMDVLILTSLARGRNDVEIQSMGNQWLNTKKSSIVIIQREINSMNIGTQIDITSSCVDKGTNIYVDRSTSESSLMVILLSLMEVDPLCVVGKLSQTGKKFPFGWFNYTKVLEKGKIFVHSLDAEYTLSVLNKIDIVDFIDITRLSGMRKFCLNCWSCEEQESDARALFNSTSLLWGAHKFFTDNIELPTMLLGNGMGIFRRESEAVVSDNFSLGNFRLCEQLHKMHLLKSTFDNSLFDILQESYNNTITESGFNSTNSMNIRLAIKDDVKTLFEPSVKNYIFPFMAKHFKPVVMNEYLSSGIINYIDNTIKLSTNGKKFDTTCKWTPNGNIFRKYSIKGSISSLWCGQNQWSAFKRIRDGKVTVNDVSTHNIYNEYVFSDDRLDNGQINLTTLTKIKGRSNELMLNDNDLGSLVEPEVYTNCHFVLVKLFDPSARGKNSEINTGEENIVNNDEGIKVGTSLPPIMIDNTSGRNVIPKLRVEEVEDSNDDDASDEYYTDSNKWFDGDTDDNNSKNDDNNEQKDVGVDDSSSKSKPSSKNGKRKNRKQEWSLLDNNIPFKDIKSNKVASKTMVSSLYIKLKSIELLLFSSGVSKDNQIICQEKYFDLINVFNKFKHMWDGKGEFDSLKDQLGSFMSRIFRVKVKLEKYKLDTSLVTIHDDNN